MISPIRNEDLVLKVDPSDDTKKQVEKYDAFLDLVFDEEYYFLREAAYNILYFLFSGSYLSISDLVKENFKDNSKLVQKYSTQQKMLASLQLPDKKSCTVDLATGTGKSYLIYAIAQIAMHADLVDQVLVLSPSVTIETGLMDKFNQFAGSKELRNSLPAGKEVTPRIINANQTILPGDICVENIHAVYANTNASIGDSLRGNGERTLILNDEAHHIFNKVSGSDEGKIKEWKKFLVNEDFNFKFIVNFTGTPYIDDEYFSDVIYRYPVSKAITEHVVKTPSYLIETGKESKMKGFEEIYQNHSANKSMYTEVKPISIIVTSDINTCYEVWENLVKYITKIEGISKQEAEAKCIWVVSSKPSGASDSERKENLIKLRSVDNVNSPVEWIISVAMLTEGWDVKNVFQIVPHDSRAFNSKLLISQVLGRGLRIPKVYAGRDDIKVKIYNHIKFSVEIQRLFDDVLELNDRLPVLISKTDVDLNFRLHNFSYEKDEGTTQVRIAASKFSEVINLQPQAKTSSNEVTYQDAIDRTKEKVDYVNDLPWMTITDAANSVFSMLKAFELEQDKNLADSYSVESIKSIILKNLHNPKDDFLSIENLNRIKGAFRKLYDVGGETIIYKNKIDGIYHIETKDLPISHTNGAALKKGSTGKLFYKSVYEKALNDVESQVFQEMLDTDDYELAQIDKMKTPMLSVASNHSPEKKFLNFLLRSDYESYYDSFIKSADRGFYSVPYSYKKGTHMKYLNFNPDFFIKKPGLILVVEIKSDQEDANETRAKLRDSQAHFSELNKRQSEFEYLFFMLSPQDYETFFIGLTSASMKQYQSSLMERLALDFPDETETAVTK
jgi:type III restriction enzyme